MAICVYTKTKMLRLDNEMSPSLAVAGKHKPQAVSDWLNPLILETMSAFGYIENSA